MRKGTTRLLIGLLHLLSFRPALAQGSPSGYWKNTAISLQGSYGSFLTIAPKAQYLRDSYTSFGELAFSKQTDGRQPWQTANHYPRLGVAAIYGNTGSRKYIGHMAGAFPFVSFPLLHHRQWTTQFRLGTGAVWIQKPYDPVSNYKNALIGSRFNYLINMMLENEIRLSGHISLNAGLSFTHISNGCLQLPNLGLNIPALTAGITYHTLKTPVTVNPTKASYNAHIQYMVSTSVGMKQSPWVGSPHYVVNVLSAEASRAFNYSNRYGAGLSLFYDRSLVIDASGLTFSKEESRKVQGALYALYEHQMGKVSIPVELGFYVYHPYDNNFWYQSLGLRYRLAPHWQWSVQLKTHLGKADYIHTGFGYTF